MHRVLLIAILLAAPLALPGVATAAATPECVRPGTCDALGALGARSEALNRDDARPVSGSAAADRRAAEDALRARSEGLNRLYGTDAAAASTSSGGAFDWTAALLGLGTGIVAAAVAAAAVAGLRRRPRRPIAP